MKDQGIVIGPALGLKNAADGISVQTVGAQTIDRLRGNGHQASLPQQLGGGGNLVVDLLLLALGIPQVKV